MQTLIWWDVSHLPHPSSIQQWVEAHCGGVEGIFFFFWTDSNLTLCSGWDILYLKMRGRYVRNLFWSFLHLLKYEESHQNLREKWLHKQGSSYQELGGKPMDMHVPGEQCSWPPQCLLQTLLLCYLVFKFTSDFIFYIWTNHIWHEKYSLITAFFSITPS